MKSFSRFAGTVLASSVVSVFCTVAVAQTTPPTQTSPIQTLNQETTLPFTQIAFNGTPTIPANILAAITGGALEVRQLIEQRADGQVRVRHILVQPGSPNPTPAGAQTAVVDDYLVRVDNVVKWPSVANTPPGTAGMTGSITIIGTVAEETVSSPFGPLRGLPFIYAEGFTPATGTTTGTASTSFSNATLVIPGRLTTFVASGQGTLTLTAGGSGGSGGGPTFGIADQITTIQTEVRLDPMVTNAGPGPLTYMWRVVRGSAVILDPTAATTVVQVPAVYGESAVEVTVTDAAGQSTKKQITILYAGTGNQ